MFNRKKNTDDDLLYRRKINSDENLLEKNTREDDLFLLYRDADLVFGSESVKKKKERERNG